eukprot:1532789-Ditylum_brightwellii.AAC.1
MCLDISDPRNCDINQAPDVDILALEYLGNMHRFNRAILAEWDKEPMSSLGPVLFFSTALNIHFIQEVLKNMLVALNEV